MTVKERGQPPQTPVDVSVVIPCLNEAETLEPCLKSAFDGLREAGVRGEVIVVDNGSIDDSRAIAEGCGARLVQEPRRGYGTALRRGCSEARGGTIVMADADGSYDLAELSPFVEGTRRGTDLVMGTRIRGTILPGAMPWKNRYIGNPFLTSLVNVLFGTSVSDVHCGMRAFSKEAFLRMRLRSSGMEFASEMVMKAAIEGMKIEEVPITFRPDRRSRPPHLRPWRDGWRHLKLILLFSPSALFLIPGLTLAILGLGLMTTQLIGPPDSPLRIGAIRMDFHWAILGSLFLVTGYQIVVVHFFAKVYAVTHGLLREDRLLRRAFHLLTLERVLAVSMITLAIGLLMDLSVVSIWVVSDLGPLASSETRVFIFGSTLVAVSVQTIFDAFFFSILGDRYEPDADPASAQIGRASVAPDPD